MVAKLGIIPHYAVAVAVIVLFGLAFCCVALASEINRPARFVTGVLLSIILAAVLVSGGFMAKKTREAAQIVTAPSVSLAEIGVYINAEDSAVAMEDLIGYTFGILKVRDREDIDKALQQIREDLDSKIFVAEYDSMTGLISALRSREIQAAVIGTYNIGMLGSLEGEEYSGIAESLRLVGRYEVESSSSEILNDVGAEEPTQLNNEDEIPEEQEIEDHTFAVCVSGIDSYGAVSVKSRSDVNVVAFINDSTHQILLVNTPRDYYVNTTVSGEDKDRLSHAGLWGPECSMGTLAALYDCNIDYYFRINFSGFENVVDALGGVDFYLAEGYPALHLNGSEALLVARDRTYLGSEVDRGTRHMAIISALIRQTLSTDILKNYSDVLDAVSDSFDTSVPYDLISRMVKEQLINGPSWEIITYSVSGSGATASCFSFLSYGDSNAAQAYVLIPDYQTVQTARELIRTIEGNGIVHPVG